VRKYVTTYVLNVILVACVLFTNMDDTVTPLDCHSVTKLVLGAEDAPKKLLVTVCIHGNEICGLEAVNRLLHEGFFKHGFDTRSTRVTILLGNPRAVMENKRYIDVNLNRMFLSHVK